MKALAIILLSLLPLAYSPAADAQPVKLSLSPTSVVAWGITPVTAKAELSWQSLSIVWIGPLKPLKDRRGGIYAGLNTGLFWHPIHQAAGPFWVRAGAGIFKDPFPNRSHTRINASIKAGINLGPRLAVSYSHISNASTGRLNPGVDNISLTININQK